MNYNLKETLIGIIYAIVTMLFMVGMLPWSLVSSIIGCVVEMCAILRIRKKTKTEESVKFFTISYVTVVIVIVLFLNSISISA